MTCDFVVKDKILASWTKRWFGVSIVLKDANAIKKKMPQDGFKDRKSVV